jgi:PAS domain S-box-containing protein
MQRLRPPLTVEEHDRRAAALANAVLWICFVGALAYLLGTLKLPVPLRQRLPLAVALAVPLVGLYLLRRGAVRAVGLWLICGLLVVPLWGALRSGGLRSASVTLLFVPVMLAGELLGTAAALATAAVAAVEVLVLVVVIERGWLPAPVVLHDGRTYALVLVIELLAVGGFAALGARLAHRTVAHLGVQQRAARHAGEYIAETLDASPDALFSVDPEGIITRTNRAHARLLERPARELVGRHFLRVHRLTAVEEARVKAGFAALLAGEPQPLFSTTHKRRDGSWASLEVNPRLFVRSDGSRSVEISIRDVTARVEAEQRAHQLQAQLHEARRLESVGRLASGVAHDFNNVLTVILANATEARAQSMLSLAERQHLELITDAAERGGRLTQQLLSLARRRELGAEHTRANIALGDALAAMRPFLQGLLGHHDQLRVTIDANPHVAVEPAQLDQVIVNLIVNARDAMPNGGLVDVQLGTDELAPGARPPLPAGSYAVLRVSDTGVGMDPAVADHVFEPFFTTKDAGKGTGLGLYTVWAIAQQVSGHVFVTSTKGAGTRFEVYLPRLETTADPRSEARTSDPALARAAADPVPVTV